MCLGVGMRIVRGDECWTVGLGLAALFTPGTCFLLFGSCILDSGVLVHTIYTNLSIMYLFFCLYVSSEFYRTTYESKNNTRARINT